MKIVKIWASTGKVQLADLIEEAEPEYPIVVAIFFKGNVRCKRLELVNTANANIFIGAMTNGKVGVVVKEDGKAQYMAWRGDREKFLSELRNATYATHSTSTIYSYFGSRYYEDVKSGFSGIVGAFKSVGLGYAYDILSVGM